MDIREKMVELMKTNACPSPFMCDPACRYYGLGDCFTYRFADHLVAHGVTVQDWVSVDDKLPPYNHNVLVYRPNMAMEILVDNYSGYYGEDDDEWHEGWALYGEDAYGNPVITHWAYFPQPPKGE